MRHLVITVTCDHCGATGTEDDSKNILITVDNKQYELDLCRECEEKMLRVALLRPAPKAQSSKGFDCINCDKSFGTVRGLTRHRNHAAH